MIYFLSSQNSNRYLNGLNHTNPYPKINNFHSLFQMVFILPLLNINRH